MVRPSAITCDDVYDAADFVLKQGARPTVDRVRHKIGRGCYGTITPLLDDWYRNLGNRLFEQPRRLPTELPPSLVEAAEAMWAAARSESRRDTNERIHSGLGFAARRQAELEAQASVHKANALRLTDSIAELESQLNKLQATNADLEVQLGANDSTIQFLKGENTALRSVIDRFSKADAASA